VEERPFRAVLVLLGHRALALVVGSGKILWMLYLLKCSRAYVQNYPITNLPNYQILVMRILHIGSGNLYGGVETYLVTLAKLRNLRPQMESEFALCFDGRLSEELRGHNAQVHLLGEVRVRYPWTVTAARAALRKLLHEKSYDAVVCHSAWPQALFGPVVRGVKIPLVFYLHGAADNRHWVDRWAARVIPDFVICNSRYTQSTLPKMYPGVKSDIVYFPVAAPQKFTAEDRRAVRSDLQTPADSVVIIQVSRMEAWKGHMPHLEALAGLPQNPKWTAWIVGGAQRPSEVEYAARLKEKASEQGIAGRLRFTGQRNDVPRLLAAADIFCQPNLGPEPFGIGFVEALYAGLPVVTTAMGGALEIVDDACGILLPPDDRAVLASALHQLLTDPQMRKRLASSAPPRAHQLCDPKKQMMALENLLSSAISRECEACCDRQHA
jgi:glycosyltransferase involved in cell wall biosynthesis